MKKLPEEERKLRAREADRRYKAWKKEMSRRVSELPPPLPGVKPGKWRTRKRDYRDTRYTDAQIEMSADRPYIENKRVEIRK